MSGSESVMVRSWRPKQANFYRVVHSRSFFIKSYQEITEHIIGLESRLKQNLKGVKQFGSRSDPTFVGPDLGPNCLQRSSTDNTSWQRFSGYVRTLKTLIGLLPCRSIFIKLQAFTGNYQDSNHAVFCCQRLWHQNQWLDSNTQRLCMTV